MTIRIYPSRLPGEPIETHQHQTSTIHAWLIKNVTGFSAREEHPIVIEVNGYQVKSEDWSNFTIIRDDEVCIYPKPYGTGLEIAAWVAVGVAIASAAYSIYMMRQLSNMGSTSTGDQLDLNPAKANTAKLGDPIREIFGKYRVYPDYLVQPISRFDSSNRQIYRTQMFLSLGVGNYQINQTDIKIGNTPIASFGDDVSYTIYPPGADVSGDSRADNWYNSTEVGGTTSGTAGLDLASTGPSSVSINSDAVVVSGNTITLVGETSDDDDDTNDDSSVPDSWKVGADITVEAPDTFTVASEGGKSIIYGDFTELSPYVGFPVTAVWNDYSYDLYISSFNKGSAAVPGQGGNAASITANAAPTTYDFSSQAVSFTLTWASVSYVISLTANYVTLQGLTDEITDQLTGSGLIATGDNTLLAIKEKNSPFSGNDIGYTVLPSVLFGNAPVVAAGTASSGGTPEVLPSIALAYDSATGTAFSGIPVGAIRLSLSAQGNQYRITAIDGLTITVERLIENSNDSSLVVDANWSGFTERTLLDSSVTGDNDDYNWMGPFLCCPDGETTSTVEMNFVFTNGLARINKKGHTKWKSVRLAIQYRLPAGDWVEVIKAYGGSTLNEIGFTEVFNLPSEGQYEFRVRRIDEVDSSDRDAVMWQAMRAKLSARPTSYADITTLAVTVRTGTRLAAQSDRRVDVVATRLYDGYPSRSISGALNHLLSTTDAQVDTDAINALEANYWTPRKETFDYSADSDNTSMLDILQKIATAGMGYFHLSDGLATVGREGVKNWSGVITPQETTEELTTAFKAATTDDYDGVDVTYMNATTWAKETVQCRTSNNPTPNKVESYELDGVVTEDRAYRIGMRRLMKYLYQRLTYSTSTELDALCYRYGDRVVMTDDIPGSNTISCLVIGMQHTDSLVTIETSERLDWSYTSPRVLLRLQDGSATGLLTPTRVDDFTFTVPNSTDLSPELWDMDSGSIEPPRVILCSSERAGYDTLISEISPDADGTCQVTALAYDPKFYQHDDDTYPGNVS